MEMRLTLLHECIHTDFALGEHRQRWNRRQEECQTYYQEIEEKESGAREPAEVLNHQRQRGDVAFTIIQLPDEIVAEQKLKRDYSEFFAARALYYTQMQQRHEKEIATQQPDDPFWPFKIFYELLRTSFFIPLVQDMPDRRAEMMRLAQNAEARLRDCATPDLLEFLLTLKPQLLAVSLDTPITEAETAYERLHDRIMSVDCRRASC